MHNASATAADQYAHTQAWQHAALRIIVAAAPLNSSRRVVWLRSLSDEHFCHWATQNNSGTATSRNNPQTI